MPEHIFVFFFSGSENHQLNGILTQFIHHIGDQIKTFLICQAGYHTKHHSLWIHFQSQFLLKSCLIFYFFFSECLCIIIHCDHSIRFRIIFVIIDSVYDTTQAVASRLHQSIQPFPVEWGFDFFRISVTYRCDRICIYQTAFQIVGIFIRLQFVRCKEVIRQTGNTFYSLNIPYSLEFQVVDGHN